jgi:hypothetical protein
LTGFRGRARRYLGGWWLVTWGVVVASPYMVAALLRG